MGAKTKKIILALGGNIGDVPATFAGVFNILAQNKVKILGKSKIIKCIDNYGTTRRNL